MKNSLKTGISLLLALTLTAPPVLSSCSRADPSSAAPKDPDEGRIIVAAPKEEEPVITPSALPGIYTEDERPARLTLTTDSGYRIRYTTTTAMVPTADSLEATGDFRLPYNATDDGVTECAVVRAALFDGKTQVGQCYTFTYFSAPEGRFTTPVFSLVSDPAGLYGYEEGILVEGKARDDAKKYGNPKGWVLGNTNANFYNGGIEWERATSMEFSEDGEGLYDYSSNAGIRVNGGWTRANTQKSLKIFSRKSYTPTHGTFTVDLYPGYRDPHTGRILSFANTILLRGGSNNEGNNVIATPLQLSLCEGTGQILPAIRPVTEFINGKYRGVFMMIEDYDADFIEAHFGVPEEELTILSGSYENYGGSMWTLDTAPEEEAESAVKDFIRTLSKLGAMDPKLASNLAKAEEQLDLRNFIEYMCIELYCGNSDWPDNNLRAFRRSVDGYQPDAEGIYDGRWRFLLKDLDISFGTGHNYSKDPYHTIGGESALLIRNVFNNLMKNETFANRVYMYFCTLATAVFKPSRVQEKIGELSLAMLPEMEYTTKSLHIAGGSVASWQTNVAGLRSYALKRVDTVLSATEKACGRKLSTLTLSVNGAGDGELGWFGMTDGEVRRYPKSTPIPLDLPEGAEASVDGGTLRDGTLILTSDTASLTVTYKPETAAASADGLVLNEVALRGVDNAFVELYNGSDADVSLDGYSIGTGGKAQTLDGYTVPAKGYFTLTGSGEGGDARLTFSKSGGTLTLACDGEAVDSLPLAEVHKSIQCGRIPDGGEMVTLYVSELTPGGANGILPAFEMGTKIHDAVVAFGYKTDLTVKLGDETLIPLSLLKSPFKFARDLYRTEYEWIRDHESEKMSIADLRDMLTPSGIKVELDPARNLLIIQ
ncbi:MAG: CotH kinase family protein [Clostridia bacterium]|nr:CotH kinase family protein [Clostridia bacterium]